MVIGRNWGKVLGAEQSGGQGKGQPAPGVPVSSLASISIAFLAPQDSPLCWELMWPWLLQLPLGGKGQSP